MSVPLLILANKQDLPHALSAKQVQHRGNLLSLVKSHQTDPSLKKRPDPNLTKKRIRPDKIAALNFVSPSLIMSLWKKSKNILDILLLYYNFEQ